MKRTRVFVSGGAGVIGRELVLRLIDRGATVLVGDLQPRPALFPRDVHYRQGDLNTLTAGELQSFDPEYFFHLAATFERSTETYEFWEENFWHNVRLSHHLMTLAKDLDNLRRVIFASSYLIYTPSLYQFRKPRTEAVALREDLPVLPRNLTGMAKLAHEIELRFLDNFRSDVFSTVCARIFRGYGRGSRDVISRWIRDLIAGKPIEVFRPEGIFDFIYAPDTAEGLLRVALAESVTGAINLGTGHGRKVQDIVEILQHHFPGMGIKSGDSDIPYEASRADMAAFEKAVNWLPEYSLETAIPEIVAYERERAASAPPVISLNNILVTSASRKVPMVSAVARAARRIRPNVQVLAGDVSGNALSQWVADGFWKMPPTTGDQLDTIISECAERSIGVIIPSRDGELEFWATHRDRLLEYGIHVVVSSPEAVRLCLDKLAFAEHGKAHGLPFIPATTQIDDIENGPYVVKERFGAGARGIGLDLTREQALAHAAGLESPIFQPFLAGREISIDAWMDRNHRVKGLVLRTRDRVVGGESQVTTTFRNASIEKSAADILETLKLTGPVVLQALLDDGGSLQVIECNARFGGASTTAIAAGLDSFYWSLLEAGGADVSEYPFDREYGELRLVRVPNDLIFHDPDI